MKVCHVISNEKWGGIVKVVSDLDSALNMIGVESKVLNYVSKSDIEYPASGRWRDLYGQAHEVDIIHYHVHIPEFNIIPMPTKVARVVTAHSISGYGRDSGYRDILKKRLRMMFMKRADALVYNSHYTRRWYRGCGLVGDNEYVVHNGTSEQVGAYERRSNATLNIGIIAKLIKLKRVKEFVATMANIVNEDSDISFHIYGTGSEEQGVIGMVHELGIESNVVMHGYVSDIEKIYRNIDMVIITSTTETFGLVAIESYMRGMPVLCYSDVGGTIEVIEIVNPQDICSCDDDMVTRVLVYRDEEMRRRVGACGKEVMRRCFTASIMAKKYYDVYKHIA